MQPGVSADVRTFRAARLFFSGCVAGGVLAALFSLARDLGVAIEPERLVASLLSPPLPPPGRFAAIGAFVALCGLLGLLYGWALRRFARRGGPAAGAAVAVVHLLVAGIAVGLAPLWHPHVPPLQPPGFFYAAAGASGLLLFVAAQLAFGAWLGWTARARMG